MQRRKFTSVLVSGLAAGGWGTVAQAFDLTESDAAIGVRAALSGDTCGLLALLSLAWPAWALFWMVGPILLSAVYLLAYSYHQYRQRHR